MHELGNTSETGGIGDAGATEFMHDPIAIAD
jgi:hypothetical protein